MTSLENEFKEWLKKEPKSNEEKYSERTIDNYCNSFKK